MNNYKLYCSTILLFMCQILMGQHNVQNPPSIDTISFRLTDHNNISIKTILNETDTLDMMFHTAAGSVTLTTEISQTLTNIKWDEETDVNSWGGKSKARYSANNTLSIGDLTWDSIAIWENEHSGPTTDGKFGPNLFDGKVLEIDFDHNVIILQPSLPNKITTYQKLPLFFEDDFMFIEGISEIGDVTYKNKFLIHSGYGGTILYDDQFVADSKIGEKIEITDEKELKDSYGNVLKTKKGTLAKFMIGDKVLENIPVGFFEGTIGRQQMSVMGGDVLKRFNIIIDADRTHIYLISNKLNQHTYTTFKNK